MKSTPLLYFLKIIILAAVYFGAAKVGLTFSFFEDNVTLVWPPAGIALAALLLFGFHLWPGLVLGVFLATLSTGAPLTFVLATAIGNPLEALAGAYLLHRAGFDHRLARVGDVSKLIFLGAILSATVSAIIGVAGLSLAGMAPWSAYFSLWWGWWLGDAMGILVIAPVLLTWAPGQWLGRRLAEGVALLLTGSIVSGWVFGESGFERTNLPLAYLPFPVLIWAALRFGSQGAALISLLINIIGVWGASRGYGPFAPVSGVDVRVSLNESLLLMGLFTSAVSTTALFLAAINTERQQAVEAVIRDLSERKQVEEALRFQKTLLECQSEASLDGILVVSNTREWLSYNRRFIEIWGLPEEVVQLRSSRAGLQTNMNDVVDAQAFMARVEYLYEHRDETSQDEIRLKDGRILERYSAPVKSKEDVHYGRVWYYRDITERKQTEEALRRSEERFAKAFQANPAAIAISRLEDGRYVDVNEAFLEIHGCRRQEIIGRTAMELNLWVDEGDREKMVQVIHNQGRVQQMEFRFRVKSGEIRQALASMEVIEIEGAPHILSMFLDITERKRAEEALRESEARLQAAVENLPLDFWISDKEGQYVFLNSNYVKNFGAYLGKHPKELDLPPDILAQWLDNDRRALAGDLIRNEIEHVIQGEKRFSYIIVAPIWQGNSIQGTLGFRIDLTDLKRAEEEIRKLNEELEMRVTQRTTELNARVAEVEQLNRGMVNLLEDLQTMNRRLEQTSHKLEAANQELEAFAYSVSHDLRTPLRHIGSFARLLRQRLEAQLDPEGRRYLDIITESVDKMEQLIEALLAFSRMNRVEMQLRPVDLNHLVQTVRQELTTGLEHRSIAWEINHPLPTVEADPILLRQVWLNLLSNAIKYTAPRPEAHIEISTIPADLENPKSQISWTSLWSQGWQNPKSKIQNPKSEVVTLVVRDNGVGFDMQFGDYPQVKS